MGNGLGHVLQNLAAQVGVAAAFGADPSHDRLAQLSFPQVIHSPNPVVTDPVRQLTSSQFFKAASPRQQSSLLHSLYSTFVRTAAQRLDVVGALLDQLSSICDTSAYERLTDEQRLAVLSIAHLEIPNFERIFSCSSAQSPISKLSQSSNEGLVRLATLARQPSERLGASGSSVVRQLLSAVLNPDGIRQMGPTCYPTVLARQLALAEPEEFIRLTADLVEQGTAITKHGLRLRFNDVWRDISASKSFGFPVAQVLPWALYQEMNHSPLHNIEESIGLGEFITGLDAAWALGRDVTLRVHDKRAGKALSAGDIIFLTPDQDRCGHVLQVAQAAQDFVTLYDPNGTLGLRTLVTARVKPGPGEIVEPDGFLVRISPSLLARIVATSFRLSAPASELPRFAVEWVNGEVVEFRSRESLQAFIEDEQRRFRMTHGDGSVLWGAVLIGMSALAAYGLFRASGKQEANQP